MTSFELHRLLRRVKSPESWSVGTRRAFLVALPLYAPIWLVLLTAIAVRGLISDAWESLQNLLMPPQPKHLRVVFRTVSVASSAHPFAPREPRVSADASARPGTAAVMRVVADKHDHVTEPTENEKALVHFQTWNWADGTPLRKTA